MKLSADQFVPRFLALARQHLGQPARDEEVGLSEARRSASLLGARDTLKLAQEAAVSLVDEDAVRSETDLHDRVLQAEAADGRVSDIWKELSKLSGTDLPTPKVSDSDKVDLGAQAGNQVYLEHRALSGELSSNGQLTFVMAHEMGHAVHFDNARREGIRLAWDLFSGEGLRLGEACRQASRQMELEADAFAARLMRGMNCNSAEILGKLLSLKASSEHPDGLERASVVRGYLPVSDEVWCELLEKTATVRVASRKFDEDEAALRKAMARLH